MANNNANERLLAREYIALIAALIASALLSLCLGSVSVPLDQVVPALLGRGEHAAVISSIRLPRLLAAGLIGAALSLSGAAMQGLLRNPLADGSTLGVSSGAALGAALAIAAGFSVGGVSGVTPLAILFAFLSLLLILALAYRLDQTLSTNTIILIGVIFSMFAGSLISLVVTFAGERVRTVVFWTMGSLSGCGYGDVWLLLMVCAPGAVILLRCCTQLNAFAMGEDNARSLGVEVRRIKTLVLIVVAALIGVTVSVGGSIGFVGLVTPHMARLVVGPNHRRLLPTAMLSGASFLMLADLVARTLLDPRQLPIGVVTSLIGSVIFVWIFFRNGRIR